jgi:hypothetical protein
MRCDPPRARDPAECEIHLTPQNTRPYNVVMFDPGGAA